jgi:hypothetical protein
MNEYRTLTLNQHLGIAADGEAREVLRLEKEASEERYRIARSKRLVREAQQAAKGGRQ